MRKIKLDLTKQLHLLTPARIGPRKGCAYTAPCAIGAMIPPAQRQQLKAVHKDGCSIDVILTGTHGEPQLFDAPAEQHADIKGLQQMFDDYENTENSVFWEHVDNLKKKYNVA